MALLDADYSNVDPALADATRRLIAASGGRVRLNSGYRSPERQAQLYAQGLARWGPNLVSKHVAKPGSSQHNFGRAVDLGGDLALAARLAPQYGLSQLLPDTDPVHFELIGNRSRAKAPAMAATIPQQSPARSQPGQSRQAQTPRAPDNQWKQALAAFLSQPDEQTPPYNPDALIHQPLDLRMAAGLTDEEGDLHSTPEMLRLIREREARNTPNVPLEQNILRSKALAAKLPDLLKRYGGLADKYFQPQPDYVLPQVTPRKVEAIPERGARRPNTLARIAAAIGGLIKPGAAGQFGAAELGAENEGADRDYHDALTRYKLATEQDTQAYEDQANERNLMIRNDQANRAAALQNQINRYGADTLGLGEEMKYADEPQAADLQELAGRQSRANVLGATADTLKEDLARRQAAAQIAATAGSRADATKERALQALMAAGSREGIEADRESMRRDFQDAINSLKARLGGFDYTPGGKPGAPPAITPTATENLSAMQRANISRVNATADASRKRIEKMDAEIRRINNGKALDPSKASPEVREAMQRRNGARQTLNGIVQKKLAYIAKEGDVDLSKDRAFIALDRANAEASKQLNQAQDDMIRALGKSPTAPSTHRPKASELNAAAQKRSGSYVSPGGVSFTVKEK